LLVFKIPVMPSAWKIARLLHLDQWRHPLRK